MFTSYKHSLQISFSTNTVESCDNKPSADLSLCTSLDQNRCTFASDFEEEKENGIDRSLADFLRKVGEILNYSFVSFRRKYNCFPVLGSERTKTFSSRFYRRRFHACQYCTNVKLIALQKIFLFPILLLGEEEKEEGEEEIIIKNFNRQEIIHFPDNDNSSFPEIDNRAKLFNVLRSI